MISIITPCKNIIADGREGFFRKMMLSLRQQTYQDFEHIVVDGGSQDGTLELLAEYPDLMHTIISEKDRNLHQAVNKGLKLAKGDYIYIMNSDDYFATKYFFQQSLDAIVRHEVSFTHGDRAIVGRNGTSQQVKRGDERAAFFRMPFRWQTMLIKKEVYDEIGPFDESYEIASDYKFMMQMLLRQKKGHYFADTLIFSLDGGITANRKKCEDEVSAVLHETYGRRYGLSVEECLTIYRREITPDLFSKLLVQVTDDKIRDSLTYCYKVVQKSPKKFFFPQVPLENFSEGVCNIEAPELGEKISGKIRNNWIRENHRIILATDFQYAYVRPICAVPGKGQISTLTSKYWFEKTADIVPNHLIDVPHPNIFIARQAKRVFPVEVVLRRYMAKSNTPTSICYNYLQGRREIYGISFPDGLVPDQELPMGTIITPTTKASSGYDEELQDSQARTIVDGLSKNGMWSEIKSAAVSIFERARIECLRQGVILADTKMEFGLDHRDNLMLVDELLTPDGSRYWLDKDFCAPSRVLLDWLSSKGFHGTGEVPKVDHAILEKLHAAHTAPYRLITGKKFQLAPAPAAPFMQYLSICAQSHKQ
jgi:phosphoribosylaminoimidazole-succinocarboxamide synthase